MSRNDAQDFARRLYGRIPSQYRVYDADRSQPLLALLKVISAQAANLRQDLDALWDNFFIETCDDWVVPYIGALVGTNFLQHPIGQSNRLEVWNTVLWRRTKGAPQMLQWTSQAISQWPTDIAEFFSALGWSQNLNHVRLDRTLTPDLRDPSRLDLLGRAADPFAHAVDFKPARALDQPRLPTNSLGVGIAAWSTPGRHQIKNLGVFVRRLQTFPVKAATPTAAALGVPTPAGATMFKFNPLNRDVPLFSDDTGAPITRAAFNANPWQCFGTDSEIAVRQSGILLATEIAPSVPTPAPSQNSFSFGSFTSVTGSLTTIALDATAGIRLVEPRSFQLGTSHFLITAKWLPRSGGAPIVLGTLSTLLAVSSGLSSLPTGSALITQNSASAPGQLIISVETGHRTTGSPSFNIPASSASRFPGAIVAVRADRSALGLGVHSGDGLYVYLPASFLSPGNVLTYYVADDGSTYTAPALPPATSTLPPTTPTVPPVTLARVSQGQVYPARTVTPSTNPANAFVALNRQPVGMFLPDQTRFSVGRFTPKANVFLEAALFTAPAPAPFQALGSIATTAQTAANFPELQAPTPWPAFTFAPAKNALSGNLPSQGLLSILVRPLSSYSPPIEVVLVNPSGQALLAYLPEIVGSNDTRLLVADDGSTYSLPPDAGSQQAILQQQSFAGAILARAAQGQSLPIPGMWPVQQRVPVALNLCRSERSSFLNLGELGVDPELGHFALPSQDPALPLSGISVDFMEAFGSFVGAVNSNTRRPTSVATRLVSQSGDANSSLTQVFTGAPVHSSLGSAIAAAQDGDVIEIVDSATYTSALAISIPSVKTLTIRAAAGQRPCLSFYQSTGQPAAASLTVSQPMTSLSLEGLMISGGPIMIQSRVNQLQLTACTLDPTSPASLVCTDTNPNSNAGYVLSRCVAGGLQLGPGVAQLTIADSIVDQRGSVAISGIPGSPPAGQSFAGTVQLERVTVFGSIFCTVLNASESLLNNVATVLNQQSGCIRFTRFEAGSVLPRRYRCIPADSQLVTWSGKTRLATPIFNSFRFCNPDYAQLMAAACPPEILSGSESGAEMGAFAGAQNTIRLNNLNLKLQEFMPVGLSALVLADT